MLTMKSVGAYSKTGVIERRMKTAGPFAARARDARALLDGCDPRSGHSRKVVEGFAPATKYLANDGVDFVDVFRGPRPCRGTRAAVIRPITDPEGRRHNGRCAALV